MDFDWDDMRFVLALLRSGTFSAAGESLNVNYTTVARRIKNLEQRMNTLLFEQTADRYVPTEAARSILPQLETIETEFHAINRQVFGQQTDIRGELRVTFSPSIGDALILPHINEFQELYPDIDLVLIASSDIASLGVREADIAIRISDAPPDHLVGQRIAGVSFALYAARSYLKKHSTLNHPGVRLLSIKSPTSHRQEKFIYKKYSEIRPLTYISKAGSLYQAIKNNLGIGILPCYVGDRDQKLKRLPINIEDHKWHLWLLSHPDYKHAARVQVFKQFFSEKLKQNKGLLEGKHYRATST